MRATPLVRKVAQELGVDLATVTGTGPQGRITEEDVRAATAPAGHVRYQIPRQVPRGHVSSCAASSGRCSST